ncbi:MAG: hypothetical protein M1817_004603 [Caeruleum heppii]|nr:MAG: hypothetical protein M1817_004603 [Caeruleum heppii]
MAFSIALRNPKKTESTQATGYTPPSTKWLQGTWHVTHSTLPMWRDKRNVQITYSILPPASTQKMDDLVSYQPLGSDKVKNIHGVDTACGPDTDAWDWRGKGLLTIATSHWEVLGHGECDEISRTISSETNGPANYSDQWVVTYFAKTLFTPAGIDIYSRTSAGLPIPILKDIKTALTGLDDEDVKKLSGDIFEVKHDKA